MNLSQNQIEEAFESRNFKLLQEEYKKISNGYMFNESCYQCLVTAKQVLINNVKTEQKQENNGKKRKHTPD